MFYCLRSRFLIVFVELEGQAYTCIQAIICNGQIRGLFEKSESDRRTMNE